MKFRGAGASEETNAVIGWVMVGVVVIAAAWSLVTNAILWATFSAIVAVVAAGPALLTRDRTAVVPWPLLTVAGLAVGARTVRVFPEIAGYLALATLAIVIVVELVEFTSVELSRWFAIGFGVLTTLALEALWIVAQFYSDVWLGTSFLTNQRALQMDIVTVTAVGFAVGGLAIGFLVVVESDGSAERATDEVGST